MGHDDDGDDDEEDDDDDVDDDDDDGDGNHGPHHQTIFSINAEEITVIIISSIIVIFTITITIMSVSCAIASYHGLSSATTTVFQGSGSPCEKGAVSTLRSPRVRSA